MSDAFEVSVVVEQPFIAPPSLIALIFYLINFNVRNQTPGPFRGPSTRVLYVRKRVGAECDSSDECAICMGTYVTGTYRSHLPCGHMFHQKCMTRWLGVKLTCPLCRLKLNESSAASQSG
jgi:hypothetical protein